MIGHCRICCCEKERTYEHVPPQSCFNEFTTKYFRGTEAIKFYFNGRARYTPFQRGHGGYTLCAKCNNDTGGWYGGEYANFIHRIAEYYELSFQNRSIYYQFNFYPARIIKQIIVMMLSVNDFSDFKAAKTLRNFVLDKNENGFPKNVKIFICIDKGIISRFIGNAVMMSLDGPSVHLSDMAFWPIGITMCMDGELPDKGMMEITHWHKYKYNDKVTSFLDIPILYSFTQYPGVYLKRSSFEKMMKIAQQVDAPEPATMTDSASQTPHRPAR